MEYVSSHFGYKEEYVFNKTPEWLQRKTRQAEKEKWEENRMAVLQVTRGLAIVFDAAFNKGQGADDLMPPSYDEIMRKATQQLDDEEFITEQWWKKSD